MQDIPRPQTATPAPSDPVSDDARFMALALDLAKQARDAGEVPVGAVMVLQGRVVAQAHNQPIGLHDPSGHAEMLMLRRAGQMLQNYRLPGATVYVTLEPCPMCASALMQARVSRVVYAAADPKTGAAGSVIDLFALRTLNHHTQVEGGLMADVAGDLLRTFFRDRRQR